MTTHTPGPWLSGESMVYAEGGDGSTIAHVYSIDADAMLIAAAPDLLEALKILFGMTNQIDTTNEIDVLELIKARTIALEAIRKATQS